MKARLTKRTVEAIAHGDSDIFVWDEDLPGFGVKVTTKGRRIYLLQYRYRRRVYRYTIGRHEVDINAHKARNEAVRLRGLVASGKNPAVERVQDRAAPTIAEFAERYMQEHAIPHKKPSSVATDRRNLDNHLIPLIGRLLMVDVEPADVARLIRDIAAGKTARDQKTKKKRGRRIVEGGNGVANRVLALLSKMLTLAEVWGLRPRGSNPCRYTAKFKEHKVERFLSNEELGRLGAALAIADRNAFPKRIRLKESTNCSSALSEHPSAIAAVRLLLFTGCRVSEILSLKWSQVDLERRLILLPDSKTGAKAVYLSNAAIGVIKGLTPVKGNPYFLPGYRPGKPFLSIRRPWKRICAAAGLRNLRLHDLRHSFASIGASGGLSLPMIGALLGHAQPATTARYAHLAASPIQEAADLVGERLSAALTRQSSGKQSSEAGTRDLITRPSSNLA
jgi:integrase